jgi:hypothetical protein
MSNGLAIASSHCHPFLRINYQKGDGHITMQKGTKKNPAYVMSSIGNAFRSQGNIKTFDMKLIWYLIPLLIPRTNLYSNPTLTLLFLNLIPSSFLLCFE